MRTKITQDWVIDQQVQIVNEAKGAAQYSAAVSALELLGKHLGMFPETLNVNVTMSLPDGCDSLPETRPAPSEHGSDLIQ